MTSARISRRNALVSITAIASTPAVGLAAKRDSVLSEINEADLVDFFAAKRRGLIATRFIPANSKRATVMMKNLTDRRLGVRLPTTFAGIPILGQFGGGGMIGGGGMGGGGGMMGGFQNIDPGKVNRFKCTTVCLEHGKKEPHARAKYDIVPLNQFTDDKNVAEICYMLGFSGINQNAAQAAAWHFTDEMSWEELANKIGAEHLNGTVDPYFQPQQLRWGFAIASEAQRRAHLRAEARTKSLIDQGKE